MLSKPGIHYFDWPLVTFLSFRYFGAPAVTFQARNPKPLSKSVQIAIKKSPEAAPTYFVMKSCWDFDRSSWSEYHDDISIAAFSILVLNDKNVSRIEIHEVGFEFAGSITGEVVTVNISSGFYADHKDKAHRKYVCHIILPLEVGFFGWNYYKTLNLFVMLYCGNDCSVRNSIGWGSWANHIVHLATAGVSRIESYVHFITYCTYREKSSGPIDSVLSGCWDVDYLPHYCRSYTVSFDCLAWLKKKLI